MRHLPDKEMVQGALGEREFICGRAAAHRIRDRVWPRLGLWLGLGNSILSLGGLWLRPGQGLRLWFGPRLRLG